MSEFRLKIGVINNFKYMYLVNRLAFHLKNGSLIPALTNLVRVVFYLKKRIPIGNNYVGEKALIYDEHREKDIYWQVEDECVRKYLEMLSEEVKTVLDAPYGTGRFAPLYSKHYMDVVAVDISTDMIDVAKIKHKNHLARTEFLVQDMVSIPKDDCSLDLVICFRFIPWIVSYRDAEIALSEISRVCKKYAVIELCVGKHENAAVEIDENNILWDQYNKDELFEWLRKFNFEVIDVTYLYDDKEHPGLSAFLCKKLY